MLRRTVHFEVNYKEDEKVIEGMLMYLEMELENVISFLRVNEVDPITINVYPSKIELHKVIGKENDPNCLVSTSNDNVIEVVSPTSTNDTHSYEDMLKLIIHEVIGIIVSNISNDIPEWLKEGIGGYLAKQYDSENNQLEKDIVKENVPTIDDLEDDFIGNNGSLYSILYVGFLIEKYGEESLLDLLNTNDELDVYGTTYSTISNLFILENEMKVYKKMNN